MSGQTQAWWVIGAALLSALPACATGGTGFGGGDGGGQGDSGAGGADTTDGGALPDGDAGVGACTEVTVPPGGTPGTNPGGTGCKPQSVASFAPSWRPPTGLRQKACTAAQIGDFFAACLDSAGTTAQCQAFKQTPGGQACASCLVSTAAQASWGPVVDNGDIWTVNAAGCVALLEPCNEPCARAMQGLLQCKEASCKTACPVTNDTSLAAYQQCATQAVSAGCKSSAAMAACENDLKAASHPAALCIGQSSFRGFYDAVAPVFCGP